MIWTLRENSILQAFRLASMLCLALWMREISYKEHSRGLSSPRGEEGGDRKAAAPQAECAVPL